MWSRAFKHVWPDSWGPRLDYVLMNSVRALLDVPGGTLLMLPRLLVDDPFREQLVSRYVRDPMVLSFWRQEYTASPRACVPKPSPYPKQDRPRADRTAAAQHARTAQQHDHLAPLDG